MSTDTSTPATAALVTRVREALTAAGYTEYDFTVPATGARFGVTPGFGVTVTVAWMDATPEDRARLSLCMTAALRLAGLAVEFRGSGVIYVPPTRPVTDLHVNCSYPMRPDTIAASDTCQHPANTAVRDSEGNLWWRCPEHEGQLVLGTGEVVTHVPQGTR
jgi:hypothetical protein